MKPTRKSWCGTSFGLDAWVASSSGGNTSLGRYIADFICLPARLVIEIDGATHDEPEADAKRTAELERAGYRVIRIGNSYVYDREAEVASVILDALRHSALPAAEKRRLDREGLFPTPLDAA